MGVHMNKYIPIVMTIDNNYIKQVITVIYSVMSNLSLNYDIKVYILHGRDFYETNTFVYVNVNQYSKPARNGK